MDYSKLVVVVSMLVPFFAQSFKQNLIKSDHSNCSRQAQLIASQRLQKQTSAKSVRYNIFTNGAPYKNCYLCAYIAISAQR